MAAGMLAFFIALFASLMLTVPVRALALRVGMVDLPGPRKVHMQPIPLLGGLAMFGAVMLAILFAFDGPARSQSAGIVIGATLVAAVGFLDDRGWLHHQVKLFVAMPLAAAILLASGIHAQVFELLLPVLAETTCQDRSYLGILELRQAAFYKVCHRCLSARACVFRVSDTHRILQKTADQDAKIP